MSTLQEFMANGPDRNKLLENDARIWERPWSVEEIRQHGADWSLAADSGLFLYLQDFSQKMLSKTHEIEKQLDSLIRDTKATDSRLHSVFNDFLMLSNTQFIENRVYDEEVEETLSKPEVVQKHPEQERTREQKEAELIPKMQEAVHYGLKVLESAFEHLDIKAGNSDSEDEDAADKVEAILEPKDLYVDRPLPYLIGSQAFMEQDDVGLGDLSSDEMSVDSDRDSVIESEDGKDAINSDDDFDRDSEILKKKSSLTSTEDNEDGEDSDIFGDSDEDDEDIKNRDSSMFTKELAARIRAEPTSKPEGDRASLASKRSKGRKKSKSAASLADDEDSDDMFKPPKMDEEDDYSPFGGKSGLFSGGKGLFDDDDEGDLFSEKSKSASHEGKTNESIKSTTAESSRPDKKIPAGAVSIFPDNNLFASKQDSDSEESRGGGTSAANNNAVGAAKTGGGGLFDEDEDDDDFFRGNSLKKPNSVVREIPKLKKAVDLFDDEDAEDLFNEKYSPQPTQAKREVVEEKTKSSEKKMPPGAVSVFGPGTKSLLSEGLKKRQPSASEESEKSEEKGSAPKVQTRGLFSDDEDTPAFPTIPKSQSQPEPASQREASRTSFLLFDDEEEEDLFAPVVKSKPEPSAPQPSKAAVSSLFSDDEDQWMGSQSNRGKPEAKTGGMKTSTSAPSNLPSSTKTAEKSSLFDEDDDEDLFAPTKVSSQKKSQRVALLFEDEGDDEDKESLFGIKSAVDANTEAPVKPPAGISQPSDAPQKVVKEQPSGQRIPEEKSLSPSQEGGGVKKKPAGAVSLFGGIDVFAKKQDKSQEEEADDLFLSKDSPLPNVREEGKEDKSKIKTVSLFDEEEEDESGWKDPIFTPKKPPAEKTPEPAAEHLQANSTGVFLDEELLFSQTQQKDNDPDVDLFAASVDSSRLSSVKDTTQSLFADDDDEDDLFSSVKPRAPPTVVEKPKKPSDRAPLASPEPVTEIQKPAPRPVKPKDSSSRIGKLQASLMINPTALLPGSVSSMSGPLSSSSGVSSSSLSPSPATTPIDVHTDNEMAVSFDIPVQVSPLQSAHKGRAKGSALRRPQSRAARQQAAQKSVIADDTDLLIPDSGSLQPNESSKKHLSPTLPNFTTPPIFPTPSPSLPSLSEVSPRPSELPLPVSTSSVKKTSSGVKVPLSSDEEDLFGSDDLFGSNSKKISNREAPNAVPPQASNAAAVKKDKEKTTISSIFDDNSDDLFQSVKARAAIKKATPSSFLEDEEDLFGLSHSSTPTSTSSKDLRTSSSFSKQDIFQDEVPSGPKADKKNKEKTIDASLFDDDVDIFADLSETLKPKQKSKTKGEIKSIFDDDMDDIFSVKTVKPAAKAPQKSVKTPASQENSTATDSSSLFDDPLNALGGI